MNQFIETKNKVVEVKGMGGGGGGVGGSDAIITRGYNTNKLNRLVTQNNSKIIFIN